MATVERTQGTQLLAAEQFFLLPSKANGWYELVEGEVVEVPTPAYRHMFLMRLIFRLLDRFVIEQRLGEVFPDGLSYLVTHTPDTLRVPDVSFIANARMPAEGFGLFVPFAPDFAVEIVSPGDTAADLRRKVRQYLHAGVRLVWVVWPDDRTVSVYIIGNDVPRELRGDDELDGSDVLPGFRVRVGDLFVDAQEGA